MRRSTVHIFSALLLGIMAGYACNRFIDNPESLKKAAGYFGMLSDIFLRLIKMIIAPLVSATLIAGIAHMGEGQSLGRIGVRTMGWFLCASVLSLVLGLVMVNLIAPGVGLDLALPAQDTVAPSVSSGSLNLRDFITHLVPTSFVQALASNEILQIVIFSVFVGVACQVGGAHGKGVAKLADDIAHIMLIITAYVMRAAPIGVFAAIAAVVAIQGIAVIGAYGKFIAGFYGSLILLWTVLIGIGFLVLGAPVFKLVKLMREAMTVAFSTASSEAAYPKTLEQLQRFGVSKRIASFVLPVGYSFNLDGSMMYCAFALVFIAQVYGIELSWATQLTMLLVLMVTSKGIAGVPRASLVVIAAGLASFDLPQGGLLLILAIDQFLDMGRTATNVLGNSIAVAAIAKWEGEYTAPAESVKSTA